MKVLLLAAGIAALSTCMGGNAAALGPAEATTRRVERFQMEFLYKDPSGGFEQYVVVARRVTDVANGTTLDVEVTAGVEACRLEHEILSCDGTLREQRHPRFHAEPDMASGKVTFLDARGRLNQLFLEADDPYEATGRSVPNHCGGATVQAFEHAYNAIARGSLFGRKVSTGGEIDPELEAMTRYVEFEACPSS